MRGTVSLLDTLSTFDWVLVAVGLIPFIVVAIAIAVATDYPARRVVSLAPFCLWTCIPLLLYFFFRARLAGSAAILVLAVGLLAVLLLLMIPAAAIFTVRTRSQRVEFEALVARGEAERTVYSVLALPKRKR